MSLEQSSIKCTCTPSKGFKCTKCWPPVAPRIDRWNGNTLRRYHTPSGAICVVHKERNKPRRCAVIPASCNYISVEVQPHQIVFMLKQQRAGQ